MTGPLKSRLIVGLMSGTSHDGVDAALVRTGGPAPELLHHSHLPYPPSLRKRISDIPCSPLHEICRLNVDIGEYFARAALKCLEEAGVDPGGVDAIASHGQTVCHIPPAYNKKGSTLQIGEPAVIAQKTGVRVVHGFRAADMAVGGEGAPLVPLADFLLFSGPETRAVHNIGGISNVTVVTPDMDKVVAFDTGPGNCLIDEAMQMLFGKPMDRGGKVAKKGEPDEELIETLMGHPYFQKRPPKSTGREAFGRKFIETILRNRRIKAEDLIASLTLFTARSIRDAYEKFVFPDHRPVEIIASGGGVRNDCLLSLIREEFKPLKVALLDDYGIPSEAKEALAFAVIANETLDGRPGNVPGATGAEKRVVLGSILSP
ncbi:MAG: anhydro-N-acetylmuramic acid kinase [Thermodesulfovibrionales bacterium]